PDQARAMDEEALGQYLSFNATPAPRTLFAGIRKVPPGTWLRIEEDGAIRERRYWDVLDRTVPLDGAREEEIAERLLSELRTAVRLRKISDVPVGVFLSGGIDSSTNAALFSEGESRPVRTFSIGYEGEYKSYRNELHYARKMADLVGAEHHELLLREDNLLDFLPEMVRHQDEPLADPVCVPVYFVSKLARDNGVTVCQVGEGSDELFWGYPYWKRSLALQGWSGRLPVPGALRSLGSAGARWASTAGKSSYRWQFSCEMLRRTLAKQPVFFGVAEVFTDAQKQRFLSPRMRASLGDSSAWETIGPIRRRFEEKAREPSALNWMTYLDLNLRLPELLLMRVDKMSMAVGLEARVPFLDHKFVELAMSIPQSVKTRNGTLKHILKKAVRNVIPDELIDRKKQGFGVPVYEWYFSRYGEFVRREVKEFCESSDCFRWKEVSPCLAERGWALLNMALWWKQYIAGSPVARPEGVAGEVALERAPSIC
ncbi:MAG: asparagine synthase (glutamine-hydrolyzing), partial [Candidatus Acidiferrales bacterium]